VIQFVATMWELGFRTASIKHSLRADVVIQYIVGVTRLRESILMAT
jgi:hypothetical protein